MATIYHRYERGDSTYICPQSKPITRDSMAPVVRRLSESSERRASEQHRRSSAISEQGSIIDSFQSLKAGKLPTNEQLNRVMNRLIYSSVIENNKRSMSADGQLLLQDFQKLVVALQQALQTKNRDELFQSMIYHVRQSEISAADLKPSSGTTNQIKGEMKNGAKAAYKISKILLFNAKFRALLMDMLSVAQQILGTTLEVGGRVINDNAKSPDSNNPKEMEDLTPKEKNEYNTPSVSEYQSESEDAPSVVLAPHTGITKGAGIGADIPIHEQIQVERIRGLSTSHSSRSTGVDAATNTDTHAENSNLELSEADDSNSGLSSKEIVIRLKEIFTAMQKNPEYQKAISTIFLLFKMWSQRITDTSHDRRDSMGNDNYATTAAQEAKTIIQDWAQGKSLDPIIEKAYDLSNKVKQDSELSQLYEKVLNFFQNMLKDPNYLEAEDSTKEGNELVEELRRSGFEKYKPEFDSMLQESTEIVDAITEDPITKEISDKVKSIHNHLWYDSNGNAAFKPQLLNDIRITLIPAIFEQIKHVPLPQIIYSDKQYEIAIENMVLSGDTLMPDTFEVRVDDYLKFSPNKDLEYKNSQSMYVAMTGIQTVLEDVVFYYKRKTGFPRLSDAGVVSIHTGGEGIKINLKVISSSVDQKHTFRVDQCHCRIDKLNINVKNSRHKILYKVFNPMLTGVVKRQISKAVETKIVAMFERGDEKITKHLIQRKQSLSELEQENNRFVPLEENRRPGLFSHIVNTLNLKVASI